MANGDRWRDADGDVWEECVTVEYRMLDAETGEHYSHLPPRASLDELREDHGPLTSVLSDPGPTSAQPLADVLDGIRRDLEWRVACRWPGGNGYDVLDTLREVFASAANRARG